MSLSGNRRVTANLPMIRGLLEDGNDIGVRFTYRERCVQER
jgi:hypothetical protein